MTPSKVVHEREPPPLLRLVKDDSKVEEVNALIKERNLILNDLKENLNKAQARMKKNIDRSHRNVSFGIGDSAFLRLQSYHFCLLASHLNEKLGPQFYNPYKIVEKIGKVAYKLKQPKTTRIHVSQLKRQIGPKIIN